MDQDGSEWQKSPGNYSKVYETHAWFKTMCQGSDPQDLIPKRAAQQQTEMLQKFKIIVLCWLVRR